MKITYAGLLTLACAGIFAINAQAQAPDAGFGLTAGALSLRPWSGMSSGPTSLKGETLSYGTLGLRYQPPAAWDLFTLNVEGGAVFGPRYREQSRGSAPRPPRGYCGPAPVGPLLYTEAPGYGWYASSSLLADVGPMYFGVEGQLTGLALESGSDGHIEHRNWWINQSIGPELGIRILKNLGLEGSYHWGTKANEVIAKAVWRF